MAKTNVVFLQETSTQKWIADMAQMIQDGSIDKVTHPQQPISMYRCGQIIRIDIKQAFEKE